MFYNTKTLVKFMLRREKVASTAWVLTMVILNFLILVLMGSMMPYEADRAQFMTMLENPAMLAMVGPLYSLYQTNMGALYTLMMLVFMGITVGIMNIFLVVRHTRTDEEAGRYEVLRSLPCGRLSAIHATMVTAVVVNTIMAVLFGLTMWLGAEIVGDPMGLNAAMLWGATLGAVGVAFAGVAAIFSQLSANSRGAISYSFIAMGIFYMLRAGADASPDSLGFLAYTNPLGLSSQTWAYVNNIWWPVVAILVMAGAFVALAYWLCSFRDIDQGIIPSFPGRATGSWLLKTPFGLNIKLQRGAIIGWFVTLLIFGMAYATVLSDIDNFVAGNDMYRTMILGPSGMLDQIDVYAPLEEIIAQMNAVLYHAGFNIVQMFSSMIGFMMAMIAAVPVILFVLKAKTEEKGIRTELILATKTSKVRYLLGFVIIALVSAVLLQAATALGLYTLARTELANPADLPLNFLLESYLVYVPALWVMVGVAVLFVGLFPKRTGWVWGYYGFSFFAMMYARMLPNIEWLANLTPFGWVPQLPTEDINWLTLGVLTAIAVVLMVAGLALYKRRDINAIVDRSSGRVSKALDAVPMPHNVLVPKGKK